MPRVLSPGAIASMNAPSTGEVYLTLVDIEYAQGVIYLTSDSVSTFVGTREYLSLPFNLVLPDMEDGKISEARLSIDNVDRQLIGELRSQATPMKVSFRVVLASAPSVNLASFTEFSLRDVSYSAISIEGRLTIEDFLVEPFPKGRMTAQHFPGLFFR